LEEEFFLVFVSFDNSPRKKKKERKKEAAPVLRPPRISRFFFSLTAFTFFESGLWERADAPG
jgi:hypothetical protein